MWQAVAETGRVPLVSLPTPDRKATMSEMPEGLPKHPIGTFAFVGAYAVVFVVAWFAIYFLIYMARHPVSA